MKILVTVKSVEDPELKIKIKSDGSGIETDQMKYVVNPFDEIAVEEALRLREVQGGEVVVVCIGKPEAAHIIRTTLAMGADRAVHILNEVPLDPWVTTLVLQKVVEAEKPDLVLLGKQAIDDDMGQVGLMLAARLGWGQAAFASKQESLESVEEKNKVSALKVDGGRILVVREVDGGIETISVALPAVVTTELRLNLPRYASLIGITKAKKKEIRQEQLPVSSKQARIQLLQLEAPPPRQEGQRVASVEALVEKLHEAKVI